MRLLNLRHWRIVRRGQLPPQRSFLRLWEPLIPQAYPPELCSVWRVSRCLAYAAAYSKYILPGLLLAV